MRRLKLDLSDLVEAFENTSWDMTYYLDLETGKVILVTDETRQELNAIYRDVGDLADDDGSLFAAALRRRGLPGWQQEMVREADRVEDGFGTRYIEVPRADADEDYRDMELFIDTLGDRRLQYRLWDAINGRGAFRRFRDVLAGQPQERERWFAFKDARARQRVLDWLAHEEIELDAT
jgi:hypothetical protein